MAKEDKALASRRELLIGGAAVITSAMSATLDTAVAADPQGVQFQRTDTAVVFIDPQNDVLSDKGANWASVGASVTENRTVENMERMFMAAKAKGYEVFISPHYFYPTDSGWKFNGPLESDEFRTHSFARQGPLTLSGFPNSGADWLDRFSPISKTGRRSWSARTRYGGRRRTIWSCNWPSGGSAGSSSGACWRISAWNRICASFSSAASRWLWSRTRPPDPDILSGATVIKRR